MAKQTINTGSGSNSRDGDSLRSAFTKINQNFDELYLALGLDSDGLNLGAFEFTGSTITTTDSSGITIDQSAVITSDLTVGGDLLPQTANGGDLGSSTQPWRSLHVSNNTVFLGGVPLSLDTGTNELKVNNVPISQTITYADIPNVPTDISDLTDTGNLLGGGANTFDQDLNTTDSPQFNRVGLTLGEINATQGNDFAVFVSPDGVASYELNFSNADGKLTAPGEVYGQYFKLKGPGAAGTTIGALGYNSNIVELNGISGVNITTTADEGGPTWSFRTDGNLLVPEGTIIAPIATTGITDAFTIRGQNTSNISEAGGDLSIDAGEGTNSGLKGSVAIGTGTTGFVRLGSSTNGAIVELDGAVRFLPNSTLNLQSIPVTGLSSLGSEGDISININLSDSTQRTWRFGEDGDLTFPNGQQIAAEDSNELLIGSPDAGLILNSQTRSSRLIAKKTFDREFNDSIDYTFSATVGPPHTITVTFGTDTGLYLLELLSRLENKFNGVTDFRFDYSNIRIVINPYAEAIPANISMVSQTSGTTWNITIDQDPTAVVGNVTDIQILYDYNNTIGLDVGEDMFGIATDNDDIDIRSGRDIDLIAADDMTFRAGSTFDLTLLQNDDQSPDNGLEIITESSTQTNIWNFRFDGHLHIPGNIIGTNGISITPENAETYAYFNLPSDANASSQGVAIGNDNGKIELSTTDQGTSNSYTWKFDNDGSLTTPGGYIKPDATDGFLTIEGPLYADMVQEEGGGVRTITNGVKIRTHRAFDDIDRDWNFSWDGAIYTPRDASNPQVGAIEWRTGDVTSQVRRTEGGTLLSGRVVPPGLMLFSNNTGAVSVLTGNSNYWTFEDNGDLTIPGGIRSDGNINIDINLSDSTLRRWSFGEDGNLNLAGNLQFPDNTVQSTAWTGGRVVAVPTTSLGTTGDLAGDLAFNATYMYYCTQNFSGTVINMNSISSSGILRAFIIMYDSNTGWTSADLTGYTVTGPSSYTGTVTGPSQDQGGGLWYIPVSPDITQAMGTYTFTSPGGDIWKRIAWSGDTW